MQAGCWRLSKPPKLESFTSVGSLKSSEPPPDGGRGVSPESIDWFIASAESRLSRCWKLCSADFTIENEGGAPRQANDVDRRTRQPPAGSLDASPRNTALRGDPAGAFPARLR